VSEKTAPLSSSRLRDFAKDAAALAELFRHLVPAQRANAAGTIPYELLIDGIPDQLLLMRPAPVKRRRAVGARKGLKALARAAGSTVRALTNLSAAARDALSLKPETLRQLEAMLRVLEIDAAADKNIKGGRPPRDGPGQASMIARAVAQHYQGLTGSRATAYDRRFVKLLADVYKVVGVAESARSQAMQLPKKKPGEK
jgi:hypothetical protein